MILKTSPLLFLLLDVVGGFTGIFPVKVRNDNDITSSSKATTRIWGIRCEDKYYQLEEREDSECFASELFLRADRVVEFGETDGPLAEEQEGTWQVEPGTDNFVMSIRRKFAAGADGSDMGEFNFEVIREYVGEMNMVGDSVGITGVMVNKDDTLGDEEVGFFNMIDGTDERESYALEGRFKFEIDTTKGLRLSELPDSKSQFWEGSFGKKLGYFEDKIDWQGERQLGPGGYDPWEVLQALPPPLQEAFKNRDYQMLNNALMSIPREEAEYYLNGCMDGGLWIQPKSVQQRLGPGGYDPFEVLNVLPGGIAEAIRCRKYDMLDEALKGLSDEEIQYHLRACIDSGLWVIPPPGGKQVGPGGLDPYEVLDSLPEQMYLAFKNQNVEELNAALSSLSREEADYHLKRCMDAGLWSE